MNAVSNSSIVYTQYAVQFNQYKIYEKAFKTCFKHFNCSDRVSDKAKIRNDLRDNIWKNRSISTRYKEWLNEKLDRTI